MTTALISAFGGVLLGWALAILAPTVAFWKRLVALVLVTFAVAIVADLRIQRAEDRLRPNVLLIPPRTVDR